MITDWEGSDRPLPSVELLWQSRKDVIKTLTTACRYTTEEVRLKVRSESTGECWKIVAHLMDDILIPESKNFTTLTNFSNMEYNFLEAVSSFDVAEYSEDVRYYQMSILVIFHRPKVHVLN